MKPLVKNASAFPIILASAFFLSACSQGAINAGFEAATVESAGSEHGKSALAQASVSADERQNASAPVGQEGSKESRAAQEQRRDSSKKPILINYFGSIDAANVGFLVKTILSEMANGESHFRININSTGGDPSYSISAYNMLKNLPITITTYNVNQVESAAVHLYCLGNQRYAHPRSIFTIHSIKWSLTGYSPAKIADISKKINIQQANVLDMLDGCMRMDKVHIDRYLFGDDDWYIDAKEAVLRGLAHKITADYLIPKKIYLISDGYKG
ncbi:MAG: ATP-dependent Clp protease proteolytic subunit [Candidatus Competibacteraceae bacterium]|nr:ATP-dependent Clp protease proteolytic subunit [Candidatus Competibacteraceae bacterium]MBK9953465.1 ATP-dependent Clp protease proteolytic subunit [Candidatus Competibacteraceae bacterium]